MTISMYQASAPRFANALKNLSAILDKAAAHAEAKKIDPAVLLSSRLYPDMFPLLRQVQIASDNGVPHFHSFTMRGYPALVSVPGPKSRAM